MRNHTFIVHSLWKGTRVFLPVSYKKLALCLFIAATIFFQSAASKCATYEADYVPWSGYWWPKIHGGLTTGRDYRGHPSPFEKYDYVTTGTYDGPATRYGWEYHYDSDALFWEGLCFCWSAASILEEEPVHRGVYKGTVFHVGDKKGLLTAAYFGTLFNQYSTDKPSDFHRILEDFIAHQKTPIIMDLGTGGQSWNYPVFKYDTDYTEDGNTRHYTTTVYYASDQVRPDIIGTHALEQTYYYYFISDEDGSITESGWENGSTPPVNATEPFGTEILNTGLDYDQLKEIVNTVDDPYEENDSFESATSLSNGRYTLVAINSDYFKAEMKKGDVLNIRVAVQEDIFATVENDIYLRTYTPDGELIEETSGTGEQTITGDDQEGTYFFEIAPVKASQEPVYELILQHRMAYQGIFPIHPAGKWLSGMALSKPYGNGGENMDRTVISLMDRAGFSKDTFTDNWSGHLLGMLGEDFGLFPSGTEYIRVDSDAPFWGLQIATAGEYLMSGSNFIPLDRASADIFFPYFNRSGGWNTSFGLINTGNRTEEILRQSYDQEGHLVIEDTITLAPGQKMEEDTSSIAILISDARSMSAAAVSGRDCLTGYVQYLNPSVTSKGRALAPLTKVERGTLVIPHIASDDYWQTSIVLMNTGEEDSIVTFSAYNAEGELADTSELMLKAKQNFTEEASDIFPDISGQDIASMKITSQSDQPLCGILLYGTTNDLQLAGLPIHPATGSSLYLPHIASVEPWWTGIGVMNAGDAATDISFSLFNDAGEVLSVVTKHLNSNQRLASTLRGLFGVDISPSAKYMKTESLDGQPVSGIYLIGTTDGFRLMGDEMISEQ